MEQTPEQIARQLFRYEPKEPSTVKITTSDTENDLEYGFEIILTILLEGLDYMTNGLNNMYIEDITNEHFECLQPWIKSLGFKLEYNKIDNDYFDNTHYCRVIFNNDIDKGMFIMKNITKNYTFLKNANFDFTISHKSDEFTCLFKGQEESYLIYFNKL